MRRSSRVLAVTGILLVIGITTVALGIYLLAAVDLAGAVLFFSLWLRER